MHTLAEPTPVPATMPAKLPIPARDMHAFHGLPMSVQEIVEAQRDVFGELLAIHETKSEGIAAAFHRLAAVTQWSEGHIRTTFYEVLRIGWRALVNGRHMRKNYCARHPDFREWWHGLVLSHQRNSAQAHRAFSRKFFAGEIIPGVIPPAQRKGTLPQGLSWGNLLHDLPPPEDLALARRGFAAMKADVLTGPLDISHIRALEYILFDDVELDFLVTVPGVMKPVKLRLIVAMDLCSRVVLGYIVRPAIEREDGTQDGLKLRDMKACVALLLRQWGVPMAYKMNLVCERGTAALPDAVKRALAEISDGQIVVHDTSMIVGQVFAWADRATGNSWGKAWLESSFNLLHNTLQALPGQKGRRYDLAPAELHGRKQQLATVNWIAERVPGVNFTRPFLDLREALTHLDDAFARIHIRQDHALGFFEAVMMWRITPEDAFRMDTELPENLRPVAATLDWKSFPESPLMRFRRLVPPDEERASIHASAFSRLMEEQKRVVFEKGGFKFDFQKTAYTYVPDPRDAVHLRDGQHFILWFHPQDMQSVYVTRDKPDLGYVCCMARFTAGRYGDTEDAQSYIAEQKRKQAAIAQRVRQAGLPRLRADGAALAENNERAAAALDDMAAIESEAVTERPGPAGGTVMSASVTAMSAGRERTASARCSSRKLDAMGDAALEAANARRPAASHEHEDCTDDFQPGNALAPMPAAADEIEFTPATNLQP